MNEYVFCMKWGVKYDANYVNRLYRMVERNLTRHHEFVCFTDLADGLDSKITTLPLPTLNCELPRNTPGKWSKVAIWSNPLYGLKGTALFIDLDTIIVDNIDCYFEYGQPEEVILERNWARPLSWLGQTSVFRFPIGRYSELVERFQSNPQAIGDRHKYEQHYITHATRHFQRFWPLGWTQHFRLHCLGPLPLRYLRPARLKKGTRIVTFPGGPNPSEAEVGKWKPDSEEYMGRWRHLQKTLLQGKFSDAKRFVMPVDWITKHWY